MSWWSRDEKINIRRVQALEEDMERVERALKSLDIDMHSLYDKVHAALGRISKRAAIIESTQDGQDAAPQERHPPSGQRPELTQALREIAVRRGTA
jgi:hypothetical protein